MPTSIQKRWTRGIRTSCDNAGHAELQSAAHENRWAGKNMVVWGKGHAGFAHAGSNTVLLGLTLCLIASLAYSQSSGRDSHDAGAVGVSSKPSSMLFGAGQQSVVDATKRPGNLEGEASEQARQRFGRDSVYAGSSSKRVVSTLPPKRRNPIVGPAPALSVEPVQHFGRDSVHAKAKPNTTDSSRIVVAPKETERPSTATALGNPHLIRQLDQLRGTVAARQRTERRTLATVTVFASAVSYGFIWWLLQGGLLLGSLLSSLPAWMSVDPLPVLAHAERWEKKAAKDDDGVERLFSEPDVRGTGYCKRAVSPSASARLSQTPQQNSRPQHILNRRSVA